MDPLWILAVGMLIVIGGVLALRLHAFIALVLAGWAVAALTPQSALEAFAREKVNDQKWSIPAAEKFTRSGSMDRLAAEIGVTAGKLAILIAMASIIGKCLLDSGGADRIVRTALGWFGERRAPLAFLGSGFLLGIPVFFDTVFYLMMPLGKAMWTRTRKHYLLYVLTIVAGATMAHSLVPPTPGPLLVADALDVPLGTMMLAGMAVGCVTSSVGYAYAVWVDRRRELPLRPSADMSLDDLHRLAQRDPSKLPPFLLAIIPILLPVVLIAGQTAVATALKISSPPAGLESLWAALGTVKPAIDLLGNKNVALIISAAIAMYMLVRYRADDAVTIREAVQNTLASGGIIILITAAGGGFGAVLRQSGIAGRIEDLAPGGGDLTLIPVAFLVTTLIRTAQGSATVAMITAVAIISSMTRDATLSFHSVYLALAIGCGSKPLAWMNDSGFWVICKMSGMTETEGLRYVTPLSAIMGIVGLLVTLLAAVILPMV